MALNLVPERALGVIFGLLKFNCPEVVSKFALQSLLADNVSFLGASLRSCGIVNTKQTLTKGARLEATIEYDVGTREDGVHRLHFVFHCG